MTEQAIMDSFVVRVYRCDTDDRRKVAGMVEATDGSGFAASFKDTDELIAVLGCLVGRHRKGRRRPRT